MHTCLFLSLVTSPSDCFIEVCVSGLFDCSGFITRVALHFILWSTVVSTCISGLSLLKTSTAVQY